MKIEKLYEAIDFTVDESIPSVEDFETLITSKAVYETIKPDMDTNPTEYVKGTKRYKECYKYMPWSFGYDIYMKSDKARLFRYFLVATIIKWDELLEQFRKTFATMKIAKRDLPKVYSEFWQPNFELVKTNYNLAKGAKNTGLAIGQKIMQINNSQINTAQNANNAQQNTQQTPKIEITAKNQNGNWYRIIAYTNTGSRLVKRPIVFRSFNKALNAYKLGIESAGGSYGYIEPAFASIAEAQSFINEFLRITKTKRNLSDFVIRISDKPFDYTNKTNLSTDYTQVDTTAGKAYMMNNCPYKI